MIRLGNYIQRHALDDAQAMFDEHQQDETVRKEIERIRSLAQFEANHFYQAGFVLLFVKAAWLGDELEVKNLYTQTFIKTYKARVDGRAP
jgi:hypothetical protein